MRVSLLLLLAACAGGQIETPKDDGDDLDTEGDADTDADSDADSDADADADCTATVVDLTPADGAVDVSVDTTVVATFSEAVTAADITVDNAPGSVTVAGDGLSAVLTFDAPLDTETTYTATAAACGDELSTSFTTAGAATEIDLTGRTYDLYLQDRDVEWVKPNAGSLLAGQLETDHLLFMVEAADSEEIDIVGAAGFEGDAGVKQYPCTYAVDFEPASFTGNPVFTAGPLDTEMSSGSTTFNVYDLTVTGVFTDDGGAIESTVVTGLIDTRPISESAGMDVCALASSFGDECIACPDDGEEACMELEVHDDKSDWIDGLEVNPDQDPTTTPDCG